jgi:hypothetical protein
VKSVVAHEFVQVGEEVHLANGIVNVKVERHELSAERELLRVAHELRRRSPFLTPAMHRKSLRPKKSARGSL